MCSARVEAQALLVLNANSRNGTNEHLEAAIAIIEQSMGLITVESRSASQTSESILKHRNDVNRVILAGGDGTINSTLPTLHQCGLPLAILPTGTANDLARALDIPDNLEVAARIAAGDIRRTIDLGVANDQFFINTAHVGLGVRVTHRLESIDKGIWGVVGYLKALIDELGSVRGFSISIDVDGTTHRMRSIQVSVGNGRFYGGGNVVDENSRLDDGRLNLYSVKPRPWWQLLLLAPVLRRGRHIKDDRIFRASGTAIRISTTKPRKVSADGELITRTPVDFAVKPGALEVFVPR